MKLGKLCFSVWSLMRLAHGLKVDFLTWEELSVKEQEVWDEAAQACGKATLRALVDEFPDVMVPLAQKVKDGH